MVLVRRTHLFLLLACHTGHGHTHYARLPASLARRLKPPPMAMDGARAPAAPTQERTEQQPTPEPAREAVASHALRRRPIALSRSGRRPHGHRANVRSCSARAQRRDGRRAALSAHPSTTAKSRRDVVLRRHALIREQTACRTHSKSPCIPWPCVTYRLSAGYGDPGPQRSKAARTRTAAHVANPQQLVLIQNAISSERTE